MMYGAKELKLTVNNMEFDYITFGRGKKPLIMIQGLSTRSIKGSALPLAYMYRIFAKDYKVYLFERRPVISDGITARDIASDIAASMDKLGITKAHVFGTSQGGMIAQYLAIDRPDLVDKLVLAVTLARNNEIVTNVINDWIKMTEKDQTKDLVRDMAEKMYSDSYIKMYRPLLPLLTILQKPKDTDRFITLAKSCLTCNTYDELHKIKCPTLILGGRQDKVVGGSSSEDIAEKIGCEIYMYEDLGHAAYEEAKDFNERIYIFLNK